MLDNLCMEAGERLSSGATVIGSEAPPAYHVVPRIENPGQIGESSAVPARPGRFEILSMSGSFMPTESQGTRSRSGGMSVSLASPDGRVVGGSVAGLLIATSPVQVVVGSFLPGNQRHQKPKKMKIDSIPATVAPTPSMPSALTVSSAEIDDSMSGHGQQKSFSFQREKTGRSCTLCRVFETPNRHQCVSGRGC